MIVIILLVPGDNSLGCASLSGTPTTVGSYQISLDATVWTQLFLPLSQSYSFDGWVLILEIQE